MAALPSCLPTASTEQPTPWGLQWSCLIGTTIEARS
jgi:hypothetical protein